MRVAGPAEQDTSVSCVIPGHERPGTEIVAGTCRLAGVPFACELQGNCGFESRFAYSSAAG